MVGEESHEIRLRAAVASSGNHTLSDMRGRSAMRSGRTRPCGSSYNLFADPDARIGRALLDPIFFLGPTPIAGGLVVLAASRAAPEVSIPDASVPAGQRS